MFINLKRSKLKRLEPKFACEKMTTQLQLKDLVKQLQQLQDNQKQQDDNAQVARQEMQELKERNEADMKELKERNEALSLVNDDLKKNVEDLQKGLSSTSLSHKTDAKTITDQLKDTKKNVCTLTNSPAYPGNWNQFLSGLKAVRLLVKPLNEFLKAISPTGSDVLNAKALPADLKMLEDMLPACHTKLSLVECQTTFVWLRGKLDTKLESLYNEIPDDFPGNVQLFMLWTNILNKFGTNNGLVREVVNKEYNDLNQDDHDLDSWCDTVIQKANDINALYEQSDKRWKNSELKKKDDSDIWNKIRWGLNTEHENILSSTLSNLDSSLAGETLSRKISLLKAHYTNYLNKAKSQSRDDAHAYMARTNRPTQTAGDSEYVRTTVHRDTLKKQPCFNFNGEPDSCRFTSTCRYAHIINKADRESALRKHVSYDPRYGDRSRDERNRSNDRRREDDRYKNSRGRGGKGSYRGGGRPGRGQERDRDRNRSRDRSRGRDKDYENDQSNSRSETAMMGHMRDHYDRTERDNYDSRRYDRRTSSDYDYKHDDYSRFEEKNISREDRYGYGYVARERDRERSTDRYNRGKSRDRSRGRSRNRDKSRDRSRDRDDDVISHLACNIRTKDNEKGHIVEEESETIVYGRHNLAIVETDYGSDSSNEQRKTTETEDIKIINDGQITSQIENKKEITVAKMSKREKRHVERQQRKQQSLRDKEYNRKVQLEAQERLENDIIKETNRLKLKEDKKEKERERKRKIKQEENKLNEKNNDPSCTYEEENKPNWRENNVSKVEMEDQTYDEWCMKETKQKIQQDLEKKNKKVRKKIIKKKKQKHFTTNMIFMFLKILALTLTLGKLYSISGGEGFVKYVGFGFLPRNEVAGVVSIDNTTVGLCFMARKGGVEGYSQDHLRAIDGGATWHLSGEKGIWVGVRKKLPKPRRITGFDSNQAYATEIGTIRITVTKFGKPRLIDISNVLYVPSMGNVTLVSQGQLDKEGSKFTVADGVTSCYNNKGRLQWEARNTNGLYQLDGGPERCMLTRGEAHNLFGHVSDSQLDKIGDFPGDRSP